MKNLTTQDRRTPSGETPAHPRTRATPDAGSLLQLVEESPDPLIVVGDDRTVLFANRRARQVLQRGPDGEGGTFSLPDTPALDGPLQLHARNGGVHEFERSTTAVMWRGAPAWMIILRDVSGLKKIEQQLLRVNRLYAALGQTARASVRASDIDELLEDVCRIAVAFGGFILARFARPDAKREELVDVAAAGEATHYLKGLRVRLDPNHPEGRGPGARTLRLGVPYICNDFLADPLTQPWHGLASRHKITSMAAIPIIAGGATHSIWFVYSDLKDHFDSNLMTLLGQMAAEIGSGIERLSGRAARRRAEKALAESEVLFRQMAAANRHVFWMRDAETHRLLYVSPAFETVFGRPLAEAPPDYDAWLALLHEEDRVRFAALIARGKSSHPTTHRYRIVRPDGSIRWVEDEITPIYEDSRMVRLSGNLTDITDQLAANRQIEFFRNLISASSDGFFILRPDRDHHIVYINPAGARHLGRPAGELESLSVWEWDTTLTPEVCGAMWQVLRHQQNARFESTHRRADGSRIRVEMVLARFLQDGDEYVAGWFRDISQRARDEARLRESAQHFQLLFEEAADGLAILEPATLRVLDCNQRAVALFDAGDKQALLGVDGNGLQVHPFAGPELHAVIAGAESGKPLLWELEFLSLKSRRFWASVAARRISLAGRQVTLVRLTDITERKQMEASMIRTQRLESIGILAGGIAHDLNNILSPILLSADLLAESFSRGPEAELVAMISSNARRGTEVVRQVLSFSRGLKSGRVAVDFRPLVEDIRRLVQETFPRNIRFECHAPPGILPVLADPTQIHQVLLNLSVNARDAMPDGGILRIELANFEPERDGRQATAAVSIRVIDTGTGIPDEVRAHIFEPFFTTKPDGLGTGLGLSTVATIVERHGGTISVESTMQKGTTFTLVFPAAPSDVSRASEQKPARHPRGSGETILVIDDEDSVRTLIEKSLEHSGYRVLAAADGTEGVARFSEHRDRIDLVLTDLMMPVMSGQAVIRQLRGLVAKLPVVAMSGDSPCPGVRSAARSNDALTRFLPKPFTIEQLLCTVRAALDQPKDGEEPGDDLARQVGPDTPERALLSAPHSMASA